ncbi:unnamed protein product [Brassica oleracea var. botrytis]
MRFFVTVLSFVSLFRGSKVGFLARGPGCGDNPVNRLLTPTFGSFSVGSQSHGPGVN